MRCHLIGSILAVSAVCVACQEVDQTTSSASIDPDQEQRVPLQSAQDSRCGEPAKSIVYSEEEPTELRPWGGELPQRQGGIVYNDKIAKRLGFEHLTAIYGTRSAEGSLPLSAKLHKGVWYVEGFREVGAAGGTLYIQICQSNGQVLNYYGTQ